MGIFDLFRKKKKTNYENKINIKATSSAESLQKKIESIQKEHQEKSYILHEDHITKIKEFDLNNIISTDTDNLTSVELNFLKYINGRNLGKLVDLPIYWSLEYNIDYKYTMSKFFNMDYIRISNCFDLLQKLKMSELKDILQKNNLPHTAKTKKILIDRIVENIDEPTLDKCLVDFEKYYTLTDKGISIISGVKSSLTKDLEFEDRCIELIQNKNLNEAYKLVCKFELSKKNPRGIGIDWSSEFDNGISHEYFHRYNTIFEIDLDLSDPYIEGAIKSAYIFSDMLGHKPSITLAARLIGDTSDKQVISTVFSEIRNQIDCRHDFSNKDPNGQYEICVTLDLDTCDICSKLDGKVFKYKNAKIGVNHPPFHKNCRCTTTPFFDDEFTIDEHRVCRNPITGKNEYTSTKTYDEWMNNLYKQYGKDTILKLKNK